MWQQLTDCENVGIWIPTFSPGRSNDPFACTADVAHVAYYEVPLDVRFTYTSHMTSRDHFTGCLFVKDGDEVRIEGHEHFHDACTRMALWMNASVDTAVDGVRNG